MPPARLDFDWKARHCHCISKKKQKEKTHILSMVLRERDRTVPLWLQNGVRVMAVRRSRDTTRPFRFPCRLLMLTQTDQISLFRAPSRINGDILQRCAKNLSKIKPLDTLALIHKMHSSTAQMLHWLYLIPAFSAWRVSGTEPSKISIVWAFEGPSFQSVFLS